MHRIMSWGSISFLILFMIGAANCAVFNSQLQADKEAALELRDRAVALYAEGRSLAIEIITEVEAVFARIKAGDIPTAEEWDAYNQLWNQRRDRIKAMELELRDIYEDVVTLVKEESDITQLIKRLLELFENLLTKF